MLFLRFLAGIILLLFANSLFAQNPDSFTKSSTKGFIQNKGQIIDQNNKPNPSVLYLLNTPGFNVQLRRGGWSYDLFAPKSPEGDFFSPFRGAGGEKEPWGEVKFHRIDFALIGSNPNCEIITSEPSTDYLNYYTTETPEEGVTDVRSYQKVTYLNIYPGIDLEFLVDKNLGFEYNFLVHPGGNLANVQLEILGPMKIREISEGLKLITSVGVIDEVIPLCSYQMYDHSFPVKGNFMKIGENIWGFGLSERVPEYAELIIDPIPTRRWGTYYGGTQSENCQQFSCVTDFAGNIFICGRTSSSANIATAGAFQTELIGIGDAFLVKFATTGQRLWGTYYGGDEFTEGNSCAVDPDGNIFLVGRTASTTNIATSGAFQTVKRGLEDGFVVKFTGAGSRIWGSYYGGNEANLNGEDYLMVCSTDTSGNVYCGGWSSSPDFIATPGATQTTLGGQCDNTLVKFTGDGQRVWGTYYGGSSWEANVCTTVSKNGFVYLSGSTISSNNIATPGSFMPLYNGIQKAFLACFNLDGTRLWGTYFGGEGSDIGMGCIVDTGSSVYLYGYAASTTNIATPGVFQTTIAGSNNGYLEKFSATGDRLWGTYYGPQCLFGAAVDDSGYVFVSGQMSGQNPLSFSPGAYQTINRGSMDAILAKFTSDGQRIWGTYYGGKLGDFGACCAIDQNDNIYLYGNTGSSNNSDGDTTLCMRNPLANFIASQGSHQPDDGGGNDVFLVKFADCWSPDTALQIYGPASLCQNTSGIGYSIDPILTSTDYHWCVSGNLTITSGQHTTSITLDIGAQVGPDTISVYGINSCDKGFPKLLPILIHPRPVPIIAGPDTTCTGAAIPYSTAAGNTGYQWTISPGGSIIAGGTVNDSTCTITWNSGGSQWIKVNYTDSNGCEGSNPTQFDVWVIEGPQVSISILESENPACTGTLVSFTATGVNGGSNPLFQWKVNGINTGLNQTLFDYPPNDDDTITCVLTSSLVCTLDNPATSNSVIMEVNPFLPVSITVTPSENPVCEGIPVTFTAAPTNGGSSPSYQWQVNATNAGTNSPILTYLPMTNDQITCILTSTEDCTSGNPASSNPVIMTVDPLLPVSITISPSVNPVCGGIPVTFTASPVNGGSNPSYQWKVNGVNAGSNAPTFIYNPVNNDSVRCVMTSNLACVSGNPASSNKIILSVTLAPAVTFTSCFDTITTINAKPIRLKGGIPLGGTYSGSGVSSESGGSGVLYYFNPAIAGTGNHLITYSYTNSALCTDARYVIIDTRSAAPFSCGNDLLDIRDSSVYPTVQIGIQCWMAANLNYGTEIPYTTPQRDNCIPEKYCNTMLPVPCALSSALYQWDEVMTYTDSEEAQGLCPPGWHIPSEADWQELFAVYQGNAFAGKPLLYSGYSGFNAQLTGIAAFNLSWHFDGFATIWWSSTSHGPWKAWTHGMNEYNYSVSYYPSYRANGFSIRCLLD